MVATMTNRIATVQSAMAEQGLDALMLVSPPNVAYVSGFHATPFERLIALVVAREGPVRLVVPSLEEQAARAAAGDGELFVWRDEEGPAAALAAALDGLGGRFGLEQDHLTVRRYELTRACLPAADFDDCGALVGSLRAVKDDGEIERLRRAARVVDAAVERLVADELRPGRTEAELADAVVRFMREAGADGLAFDPTILTGAKSALPHGHSDGTSVAAGDLVIIDVGATVQGYCADISRTVVAGREPDERQRELFDVVRRAQLAGVRAAVPGSRCADVDRAAREVIAEAGLADQFVHRTGHGLGLEPHEPPYLTAANEERLQERMIVTVEPGVYFEGYGGVRIEDDVVVRAPEPEVLTQAPIRLEGGYY